MEFALATKPCWTVARPPTWDGFLGHRARGGSEARWLRSVLASG